MEIKNNIGYGYLTEKQKNLFIDQIEKKWPDYKVIKELGSGGFGIVFQVGKKEDPNWDRAVKVVYSNNDASIDLKVKKECDTQHRLVDSPYVTGIYDHEIVVDNNGCKIHLIMMELMEGSVEKLIRKRALGCRTAVKIAIQVCKALSYMENCEGRQFVHGDIKPANILYKKGADGKRIYKLSDFGCVYEPDDTRSRDMGTD